MPDPEDEIVFPDEVPEEIRQRTRDQLKRARLHAQSVAMAFSSFFNELPQEHLETFSLMMGNVAKGNGTAAEGARYYEGFANGILAQKFDKWPGWAQNPALELTFPMDDGSGAMEITQGGGEVAPAPRDPPPVSVHDAEVGAAAEYAENLAVYGCDPIPDEPPKVRCRNCKMTYQSLADRMVKRPGPDNCEGCVHKAKWG